MADIFISYSRQDSHFVEQLRAELTNRDRSVWLDTSDIAPTSVWRQDIVEAIEAASAVLFVLSPDWLASEICQRELQYAIDLHKKLIPVVYRDVDHRLVNPALADINWILARSTDPAERALQNILFAVDTDLAYWRQNGELLALASRWNERKRQPAYTLRGEALRRAEQWLAQGASKKPTPSPLQVEFITAGRQAVTARQRTTIGALSAGIIITLILSIIASLLAFAYQGQNRVLAAKNVQLGRGLIDSYAYAAYNAGQSDRSLLLAAAAYKLGALGAPGDSATRKALFSLVHQSPHLESILQSSSTYSSEDAANYIGYSSDGGTLAYVANQKVTVRYPNTSRSQVTFSPPAPPGLIHAGIIGSALSADGALIALKTSNSTIAGHITLWSAITGQQLKQVEGVTYELQTQPHDMAFSPDGRYLASAICSDPACATTQFTVWSVDTGRIVAQLPGSYPIFPTVGDSVSFSSDGRYVAFSEVTPFTPAGSSGRVVVFDLTQSTTAFLLALHTQVTAVAFTPTAHILAVASAASAVSYDQQVAFWDVASQAQVGTPTVIHDLESIESIEFDRAGYWMLTADSDHTINVWSLVGPQFVYELFGEDVAAVSNQLTAVALSPDGTHVATSAGDGQISVWRLTPFSSASPDVGVTFNNFPELAFSADSQELLYSYAPQTSIMSWNISQGSQGTSGPLPPGSTVYKLAVSPDGTRVAVATTSSQLILLDTTTGKVEGTPWISPLGGTQSLQFSPDGRTLLACGYSTSNTFLCFLFDVLSHTLLQSFGNVSGGVESQQEFIAGSFSPNGKSIGFGVVDTKSHSRKVEVYDLASKRFIGGLDVAGTPLAVSWSPDSRYVGYLDDAGNIAIVAPRLKSLPTPVTKVPAGIEVSFQFMPAPPGPDRSSYWIMVAGGRSVDLWQIDAHLHSSLYLDPFTLPNTINSAAVSPNGKYLAAGEFNLGLISVVSLDPSDWLAQACSIAGRNLTRDEWSTYVQALEFAPVPYMTLCPGLPIPT